MEAKNINQLVTENLSYVKSLANRFKGKGVDFDDLVSEGYMAMTQAAQKYDTERGTQFIAYAASFIRKAMEQAIKQQSASYGMPKNGHQQLNKKLSRPLSIDAPLGTNNKYTLLEGLLGFYFLRRVFRALVFACRAIFRTALSLICLTLSRFSSMSSAMSAMGM